MPKLALVPRPPCGERHRRPGRKRTTSTHSRGSFAVPTSNSVSHRLRRRRILRNFPIRVRSAKFCLMSSLTRGAVPSTPRYASATPHNSFRTLRPAILSFSKLLLPFLGWASTAAGFPHHKNPMGIWENSNDTEDPSDPSMWAYIGTAGFLVLLGGAFAGLTIA